MAPRRRTRSDRKTMGRMQQMELHDEEGGAGHPSLTGWRASFCCSTRRRRRCVCCTALWLPIAAFAGLLIILVLNASLTPAPFRRKLFTDAAPQFRNASHAQVRVSAQNLGNAIKHKTISYNSTAISTSELLRLHQFIKDTYPSLHQAPFITQRVVNEYSLLYRIEGKSKTSNPYLLCAHLDVVPEGNKDLWTHNPFLGEVVIEDGKEYIFGRGAIDDKHSLFGILEALDFLVGSNSRPARTFYIAFGHDEEISGHKGANQIGKDLKLQLDEFNETLDFLLDEGMFVMKDVIPGMVDPVIYIGVTEKGYAQVEMIARGTQGHSSIPPKHTSVERLARAIVRLKDNPHPSRFGYGPEVDTFKYLAGHMKFLYKLIFGNLWLFSNLVKSIMSSDGATDAIQRTTTAITIVKAGFKANVIPGAATATINHRIHPADNLEKVLEHDKLVTKNDVELTMWNKSFNPQNVSPYDNDAIPFQIIANSALEVFPDGKIAPGLLVGNTDTKHYAHLTDNIYRFTPAFLVGDDKNRFHGIDERISVQNFNQVIEFYLRLMKNADYDIK